MTNNELVEIALKARTYAYTPYSHHSVGAALLTADGKVYTGCNIENVSYSVTMCAERVAVFQAVAAGETVFELLAIAAGSDCPVMPCGACRQVMAEFHIPRVLLSAAGGTAVVRSLTELLPEPFDGEDLDEEA